MFVNPPIRKDSLFLGLAFIHCHLAFLPSTIPRLEKSGLPLTEALSLMDSASSKISGIPGTISAALQAKMCSVLAKNPALNTMRLVGQILKGDKETVLPPEIGINTHDVVALKYCPVVSADVERSFSVYKNILSDRRHRFTNDNLSKYVTCHCFYNHESTK